MFPLCYLLCCACRSCRSRCTRCTRSPRCTGWAGCACGSRCSRCTCCPRCSRGARRARRARCSGRSGWAGEREGGGRIVDHFDGDERGCAAVAARATDAAAGNNNTFIHPDSSLVSGMAARYQDMRPPHKNVPAPPRCHTAPKRACPTLLPYHSKTCLSHPAAIPQKARSPFAVPRTKSCFHLAIPCADAHLSPPPHEKRTPRRPLENPVPQGDPEGFTLHSPAQKPAFCSRRSDTKARRARRLRAGLR